MCMYSKEESHRQFLLAAEPIDRDAKYGNDHWLHLLANAGSGDEFHFHIDVVRSFGPKKRPSGESVEDLADRILQLAGLTERARIRATYALAERPAKGLIPALSISTNVGGDSFSLTGAQLMIKGTPYVELSWSSRPDEPMIVEIEAVTPITVSETFLVEAEQLLRKGLDRFALSV